MSWNVLIFPLKIDFLFFNDVINQAPIPDRISVLTAVVDYFGVIHN